MMENLPKRKHNRLGNWDYMQPGCYFVTICTARRETLLWDVGADTIRPEQPPLSHLGKKAE